MTAATTIETEGRLHPLVAASNAIDRIVAAICKLIVFATMSALLVLLFANVVARYVLSQGGIKWIEEIPEQLFPWLIAAGIVLAVQTGGHIAVDLLIKQFARPVRRAIVIAINVLVAAAYAVLVKITLDVAAITAVERSPILEVPRSIAYYALAFGLTLTVVCSLTIAIRVAILGPEAAPEANPEDSVT
jgi:TRAP-type C4-dicarboxylate transport system permease small subunit